jgi:hypothetical protein
VYEKSRFKISKKTIAVISWAAVLLNTMILALLCLLAKKPAMMLAVFVVIAVGTYFILRWNMTRKGLTPPGKPTIPDTIE